MGANGRVTAGALAVLLVMLAPRAAAGQADIALEGLYGRADGPVGNRVLGVGARLGVPLGVSLGVELSHWDPESDGGCGDDSEPEKCEVGGWMLLGGLRVGLPFAWPVQPYVAAMVGRSLGSWTPTFDEDPTSWSAELGLRLGIGPLEGSAAYRYMSVEDLGYEVTFGDTPGYHALLLRLGYGL